MADASKIINDARKTSSRLESFLEEAIATRNELNRQLTNARRRLNTKRTSTAYPISLAQSIIKDLKQDAIEELTSRIDTAVNETEFSNPSYKYYLYLVAKEPTIYKFITSGSGWDIRLSLQIVFEEEAGDIADYARGIKQVRRLLGTKEGKEGSNRGFKATNWWYKNVYGTDRHDDTIDKRVANSGRTAPFWRLLNNGSMSMPSDRTDGSFNPLVTEPKLFVEKAERSINILFMSRFSVEKVEWLREVQDLGQFIEGVQAQRDKVSNEIRNLRFGVQENQRIFDRFGELKEFVDKDKLAEAVKRFRADPASEKRISVSAKGSKRRVFLTARRLEGFEDY